MHSHLIKSSYFCDSNHESIFMKIIDCNPTHAEDILDILNEAILNTTAFYHYKPWNMETINHWFEHKSIQHFPIIGIINEDNRLMGFSSYGDFRPQPAYKYTVENSVYVHKDFRGRGLGKLLLNELIKKAKENDIHKIIAVIDAENATSIDLHRKAGFHEAGILKEVGFKFGRWLDVALWELTLNKPTEAHDDEF